MTHNVEILVGKYDAHIRAASSSFPYLTVLTLYNCLLSNGMIICQILFNILEKKGFDSKTFNEASEYIYSFDIPLEMLCEKADTDYRELYMTSLLILTEYITTLKLTLEKLNEMLNETSAYYDVYLNIGFLRGISSAHKLVLIINNRTSLSNISPVLTEEDCARLYSNFRLLRQHILMLEKLRNEN